MFLQHWIHFIIRFRHWVLGLIFVISLLMLVPIGTLKVVIDPDESLPRDHPFVATGKRVESLFNRKLSALIVVHSEKGSVFEPKTIGTISKITEGLKTTPGVIPSSIQSLTNLPFSLGSPSLKIPEALHGILISKDQKTAQIIADYHKTESGFYPIDQAIRNLVNPLKDSNIQIWVGGVPSFLALIEMFSERMKFLFPLAVLLIGLIHYEAFRSLQSIFLPLLTALLAVLWSLGILGLLNQPIDAFNAMTPILILAVAAGHAVQMLKRYYESYSKFSDQTNAQELALKDSFVRIAPVMLLAGLIAALGFFSLLVFDVQSIRVFGLFTGLGILSTLILEMTLIPALRAVLPKPGSKEILREQKSEIWDRWILFLYRSVQNYRKEVFIFFTVLGLLFSFGIRNLNVENAQKSYFSGQISERIEDEKINEKMAGTNTFFIVLKYSSPDWISSPDTQKQLRLFSDYLNRQPAVGKVLSSVDFLPSIHPSFIRLDEKQALIQVFLKNDQTALIESLIQNIRSHSRNFFPDSIHLDIGGGATGGVALNEVMIRQKFLNILQIATVLFLVTSLAFRSVFAGILILIPMAFAVLANFGFMGVFGIPLQIATALVSAMAVGIGADYGIYLSYRLREELADPDQPEDQALKKAYLSAGKATLYVATAVAGGFSVLMLSKGFNVHIWMGLLIGLSMWVSATTALTLLPALMFVMRPRFIWGERVKH